MSQRKVSLKDEYHLTIKLTRLKNLAQSYGAKVRSIKLSKEPRLRRLKARKLKKRKKRKPIKIDKSDKKEVFEPLRVMSNLLPKKAKKP